MLDKPLEPLPDDTIVTVRPRSPLGLKYLELKPGKRGAAIEANDELPLERSRSRSSSSTRSSTRSTRAAGARCGRCSTAWGPASPGRGVDVNDAVADAPELLRGAERVAAQRGRPGHRAAPPARLGGPASPASWRPVARRGAARRSRARTPRPARSTRRARRSSEVIAEPPPTEAAALSALRAARPLLADAAALVARAPPGPAAAARAQPRARPRARRGHAGAAPRDRARGRGSRTRSRAVAELGADPATSDALERLLRVLVSAKPTLEYLAPLQIQCNYLGLWTRNVPTRSPRATSSGTWFRTLVVADKADETLTSAEPAPDLHVNPYPHAPAGRTASARPATSRTLPGPADRQRARRPGRARPSHTSRRRGWAADERAAQPERAAADLELRASACSFIVLAFCACWLAFKGSAVDGQVGAEGGRPPGHRAGPRSPVRIAGVEVGKVKKVERGRGRHVDRHARARGRRASDPRGRDAQGPAADLPRGQLLRRPEARAAPARRSSTRATRSRSRRPRRRCSSTRSCRRSRRTRARTSSCSLAALGEGFADGGAAVAQRGVGALGRGVHAGRDRRGGVPRDERRTTCPSSSTRAADVAAAGNARDGGCRTLIEGLNRTARALASRRAELSASLPELDRAARGGRSRARRAQRRLPADARARARRAARRAGGARDARARDPGARAGAPPGRARASCRRCSTSSTRRSARWRGSSPTSPSCSAT